MRLLNIGFCSFSVSFIAENDLQRVDDYWLEIMTEYLIVKFSSDY